MGLTLEEIFPGRFVRAADFKGRDVDVTISMVVLEDLPDDKGKMEGKGVVTLRETKKKWILNRTNAEWLKELYGNDTDLWIGKRITIYPDASVTIGSKKVGGIRVRGVPEKDFKEREFVLTLPRKKPKTVKILNTYRERKQASAPAPAPMLDEPPLPDEPPPEMAGEAP